MHSMFLTPQGACLPAGMPLISDPGESLVKAVTARGVKVFPIPGPSAVLSALVASGLPTTSFLFCGFLPAKANARADAIKAVSGTPFHSPKLGKILPGKGRFVRHSVMHSLAIPEDTTSGHLR